MDELLLAKNDMKARISSASKARNSAEPPRVLDIANSGYLRGPFWN